jgi:hypothetical protein
MACALVVGSGCGGKKFVSTGGSVTLDGQPVEGAVVQFHPDSTEGEFAQALSQSDGSFRARTGNADGVAPGKYRVTVAKFDKSGKKGKQSILPRIYSSTKTTPFRFTIPHGGPITLELDSKAR